MPSSRELEGIAEQLLLLCQQAGEAVLEIYHGADPVAVEQKQDNSPLTLADKLSQQILADGLARLAPQWPVVSEEQALPDFSQRSRWPSYWLLDPLDGTREFIERTGEFTINIALIENHRPILGMVYIPLEQAAYLGLVDEGRALRIDHEGRKDIAVSQGGTSIRVLSSRRYGGAELEACMEKLSRHFPALERVTAGSALKFCRLAEGRADIYPRFAPCCEWDTAAGQAVLEAAGGCLLGLDFKPLQYNQKPSIINPNFYALGGKGLRWVDILKG
ncbi:3'(2'),5'-bisphosphate nucleotidase CysQ [Oceanicoccus sagamiensis]|uniref:3'(2'),5'-bisphosphate nucleotidase CysQ n=1 Tax=Oceanicoccus sagamiensis TaxID=716816 RepID=A0A1X9N965_9GAMM|nr:3'(2'),5'-bisphosphate nucleotidase CysQ [Oceanicoccus sagamiensis]ARN73624.1 3'(2'),5'-bisphosphate nucleotidase [Oceanicoccus sagamiensis]